MDIQSQEEYVRARTRVKIIKTERLYKKTTEVNHVPSKSKHIGRDSNHFQLFDRMNPFVRSLLSLRDCLVPSSRGTVPYVNLILRFQQADHIRPTDNPWIMMDMVSMTQNLHIDACAINMQYHSKCEG